MHNWILALGAPQGSEGGSGMGMFIMLGLMFAVIYFLMIRPQQKRQKKQQQLLSALERGDRVITSSGMVGTVYGINEKDNIIVLKFGENTKIEFLKSSITSKVDLTASQ